MMRPNTQRSLSHRLRPKIMTSVLDNQPDIVLAGKIDRKLYLRDIGDIDNVFWKPTNGAARGVAEKGSSYVGRDAGETLEKEGTDGRWI